MNTDRDTGEGSPRPSVWPVYVAAAAVLIVGLIFLVIAFHMCVMKPSNDYYHGETYPGPPWAVLYALLAYGHFGVIAAIGMLRLRPWAWWSAVMFVALWIALQSANVWFGGPRLWDAFLALPPAGDIACMALAVWVLVTRRQLFFPPKQAGEE